MALQITYRGTVNDLAAHVRDLADTEQNNGNDNSISARERRWHLGRADGLYAAAQIIEGFEVVGEVDDVTL